MSTENTPIELTDNSIIPDPNPEQKLIISLDSQVLSKIQTCNQQAAYRFIDNIEPVDYDDSSLQIGLVIHEGLAEHYEQKHKTAYNLVRARSIARMEAYAPAKTELKTSEVNAVIDAYNQYATKYQYETWEVLKDTNNNAVVEKTFAKKMYEDDSLIILYTGVTDLVINNGAIITPVDHKSWGSYYPVAVMSNQFNGYMWALKSKSLIVNRVGVRRNTGKFERIVVNKPLELLEEWKRDAIEDVLNHLGQINRAWFRRNREACTMYGGCRYLKLCNASSEHRKYLVQAEYKKVPEWSPLNRD